MPSNNIEEKLLHELMLDVYRRIAPEHGAMGQMLVRKLAAGLYERGGRITLGGNSPPKTQMLHISVDKHDKICWTCKNFHSWLGYQPHQLISKHIESILSPGSAAFRKEFGLPELMRTGRITEVPATFITKNGDYLVGTLAAEMLKDSEGNFLRTFSRIVAPVFSICGPSLIHLLRA